MHQDNAPISAWREGWVQILIVIVALAASEVAYAQPNLLESLTEEQVGQLLEILDSAEAAEQDEDWSDAFSLYVEAAAIAPFPQYSFRQAFCLEHLDRFSEAAAMYRGLAAGDPDSEIGITAAERLDALHEMAMPVELLTSPAGAAVTLGDEVLGTTPLTVDLAPGQHQITVTLDGYGSESHTFEVEPIAAGREEIVLTAVPVARPDPESPGLRLHTYLLGGSTILAAGSGVVWVLMRDRRVEDWENIGLDTEDPVRPSEASATDLEDKANRAGTAATVSFILAGALGAATVVSVILDLQQEPDQPQSPAAAFAPVFTDGYVGGVFDLRF